MTSKNGFWLILYSWNSVTVLQNQVLQTIKNFLVVWSTWFWRPVKVFIFKKIDCTVQCHSMNAEISVAPCKAAEEYFKGLWNFSVCCRTSSKDNKGSAIGHFQFISKNTKFQWMLALRALQFHRMPKTLFNFTESARGDLI